MYCPLHVQMILVSGNLDGDISKGKITYLAGHDYSTSVPISSNAQTNGARFLLNGLFASDCPSCGYIDPSIDSECDGVPDDLDNCYNAYNPDQSDSDSPGGRPLDGATRPRGAGLRLHI